MARFSERIGAVPPRAALQVGEMDTALRNTIWNFLVDCYSPEQATHGYSTNYYWVGVCGHFARVFFKHPTDELSEHDALALKWLKKRFEAMQWFEVYDFVEVWCADFAKIPGQLTNGKAAPKLAVLHAHFNGIFEQERGGYRFVAGQLVPVVNTSEVEAIEQAASARGEGMDGAREHLSSALRLFAQRPEPDYRNSIKESISAVESVAKLVTGVSHGGLAPALESLAKTHSIHGAMKEGFLRLYGFTSDEAGIRHALLEESSRVGYDEAKFMLVACSAFVNFIAAKVAKNQALATPPSSED